MWNTKVLKSCLTHIFARKDATFLVDLDEGEKPEMLCTQCFRVGRWPKCCVHNVFGEQSGPDAVYKVVFLSEIAQMLCTKWFPSADPLIWANLG